MKISPNVQNLRKMIEHAIEDHIITRSEYEKIIHMALDDAQFDSQERTLIRELQDMIDNKTIRLVP